MEQREQPSTPPATPPNKHGVPAEEYESGYVTSPNTVENTTPAISDRSSTAKPFPGIPSSPDLTMPQHFSPTHDGNDARCSSQSTEVTYIDELMAENPSANIAFMGRPMSLPAADESLLVEDNASTPLQECQDETLFQQESKAGAELPTSILMPKNNVFPVKTEEDIVTGKKSTLTTSADNKEKANKVCVAVHEYYMEQFVDRWKKKTKQGSSTITVIAALLVERKNKFKVVVFTAGTKIKHKCSYFIEGRSVQDSTWGLCDGHAIAVCYRLASLYLLTEIYKLHEGEDSIFSITAEGYVLKSEINFHLFTSQAPCGFMTKEQHFLSWKPFIGKPHSLQCSSIILIGAYLGIQGPLSHLITKPIYISSITIPRYKTVDTLHSNCIEEKFEKFQHQFKDIPTESQYHFNPPHIEIVNKDPKELFPQCYKPYLEEKPFGGKLTNEELPQQETSTKARQAKKGARKLAGAIPDVLKNTGITALVFTVGNGIGSEEFRENISKLKSKLVSLSHQLKQNRFQSLQEARVKLSQALNVREALEKQKELTNEKMKDTHETRCRKVDELIKVLTKSKEWPTSSDTWHEEVKSSLDKANKHNELSNVANSLDAHASHQRMLDELDSLQEQGKRLNSESEFYLDLMGCDWARYVAAIRNDVFS